MSEKIFDELAIKSVIDGEKSFCKFLSANDTGKTGGHQSGIYIAKNSAELIFDKNFERGENISRFAKILWQNEIETESRFIYYGAKTRNEYRITNCGNKNFNPLAEENTGALLVIVRKNFENYEGWILNSDAEIENFLNAFNLSPTETGRLIQKNIFVESKIETEFEKFILELEMDFPTAEIMSKVAREIHEKIFNHAENIIKNPDAKLLQWIEMEYNLFRKIEESRYGEKIFHGFSSMQEFIDVANSILNRRKSRAGKSFENQLAAIFAGNNLKFDTQAVTEGNKKPDFIFPSKAAYHDKNFSADKLIILGAKTTCKDRWRQILNEANRVRGKKKYLCTLQQGISIQQLQEMQAEKVVLVVPKPYIEKYPKEFREEIFTLSKFINFVKETL